MSHLILRQTKTSTEQVDSSCIDDLYKFTISLAQNPDNTSYLEGTINTSSSSKDKVNTLHTLDQYNNPVQTGNTGAWDNLYVTASQYSFEFKDPTVRQVLVTTVYGGKDPTEQDVANTTSQWSTDPYSTQTYTMRNGLFQNTQIETFDELRYFIKVGSIGGWMFRNCTKLKSVTMPPPISGYNYNIGVLAFENCNNLESITLPFEQVVSLDSKPGIPQTTKIYVPASMVETYKTAQNWSNYASNIYAIE